jgi:formylglycine-generating enzyme required for sulfatase activity
MGAQKADNYGPEADDREAPVHAVTVSGFRIARFPVTVAEYAQFLDDEDHRDPRWWQAGGADAPPEPGDWEPQQAHPSRPVVGVS